MSSKHGQPGVSAGFQVGGKVLGRQGGLLCLNAMPCVAGQATEFFVKQGHNIYTMHCREGQMVQTNARHCA